MRPHERLEEGCEEMDDGLGGGGGADPTHGRVLAAGEALLEGVGLVEDAARVVERHDPSLGELDPALGPDEERLAELLLEFLLSNR